MKQLILITAMLVAMTTKLLAQDKNAIEIKNSVTQKESNQFQIVANEDVDVNLKFNLKLEDKIKVMVTNEQNEVVYARVYYKQGENRLAFTMAENEKYTVLLNGNIESNLVVSMAEN